MSAGDAGAVLGVQEISDVGHLVLLLARRLHFAVMADCACSGSKEQVAADSCT